MKPFIIFNIKKHFLSKTAIITNLLILALIILGFFIDCIIDINIQQTVYVDKSVEFSYELLDIKSTINYEIGECNDNDIIIVYNDGYIVRSANKIPQSIINQIDIDLTKIALDIYQETDMPIYKNLRVEDGSYDINVITYMISFIYVLVISLSFTLANDITHEKASQVLESLLTNISIKNHLKSKIICSYLDMVIQSLIIVCDCIIAFLLRYYYDKAYGLMNVYKILSNEQNVQEFNLPRVDMIIAIFLVTISSLVLLQIVILFISSYFNNIQQVSALNTLLYVVMLVIYIVCLSTINQQTITLDTTKIISMLPICSLILMNCRLIISDVSLLELIISLFSNVITSVLIVEIMSKRYKENILNFHV